MFDGEVVGSSIHSVILELSRRHASGDLHCFPVVKNDQEKCEKVVSFWRGLVCSASSNLIDDRLGEILYRRGKLGFDDFVTLAGMVTPEKRFGTLLVERKIIPASELWDSLCQQSQFILETLCFHQRLRIQFKERSNPPLFEYPLSSELPFAFARAQNFWEVVRSFEAQLYKVEVFELHPLSFTRKLDDYSLEMLEMLRSSGSFQSLLQSRVNLSKYCAVQGLFELYLRGYILNHFPKMGHRISSGSLTEIQDLLRTLNGIFGRMHNACRTEGIKDWDAIVEDAQSRLHPVFGAGLLLTRDSGFEVETFCRSIRFRQEFRNTFRQFSAEHLPDPLIGCVRQKLVDCLLYIIYELYNRSPGSAEVRRVHVELDSERVRWC